ncbi:protein kinase domain-containing protein [Stemphylium lycopersici]|nr:protein kinase domain-containing protein [Stemphylium lycopersici]
MPLLSADNGDSSRSRSRQRARTEVSEHRSMWDRISFQKIGSWLKKEEQDPPPSPTKAVKPDAEKPKEPTRPHSSGGLLGRRGSRKVIPGLPRPLTFKRMQSEKRDKLLEVPEYEQRRTASEDRQSSAPSKRNLSPPPVSAPSVSAPDVLSPHLSNIQSNTQKEPPPVEEERTIGGGPDSNIPAGARQVDYGVEEPEDYMSAGGSVGELLPPPPQSSPPPPPTLEVADAFSEHGSHRSGSVIDDVRLQEELEAKWILNLSMHFRDLSDREKFFVTFAEEPNRWRRVTVSCDYRNLEADSLEADLKSLHYQRDKSSRIYEAIRDSLAAIQFYDTVTNLKLETTDGRLHVHVTEDVNEIIPYPAVSAIEHLDCKRFRENAISFDSHISGFVYKVSVNHRTLIKKEIPGPDAVEEFLYEINALVSLQESKSVIRFEGVIVDEQDELIKGLLISYAEQGALVDMIYDFKLTGQLYWERRERWARQIIEGLSEIHEAGFVQGDFTLSNIVIDNDDNAKIIDINRRGCPVGWEPPELAKLIESGQRISIYIGVKSDLFQLGMVLWALAEQQDEPERQQRPLSRTLDHRDTDVPVYFRDIIRACLSDTPRGRPSAANLLKRFPENALDDDFKPKAAIRDSISTHRSDKEYIDPRTAVDLEDISKHRRHSRQQLSFEEINVPRTEYPESSGSYIIPNNHSERGRSQAPLSISDRNQRSDCSRSPYPGHRSVMSLDDSELENELASLPASRETRWEQVYVDGDTKLVQRGCGDIDVHDFASQELKDICITSPPGEMENAYLGNSTSEEVPLALSVDSRPLTMDSYSKHSSLQGPSEKGHHHHSVGSKDSFSDRVHHLAQSQPQPPQPPQTPPEPPETPDYYDSQQSQMPDSAVLANLEYDVAMDSSTTNSTGPPSRASIGFSIFDRPEPSARRVGTGFSIAQGYRMPLHQDSGFGEPERVSYESERIRHSLDESIKDLQFSTEEEARIDERLWDEKEGTMFGGGVRGSELEIRQEPIPIFTMPASPQKKEKQAVTSMPPPFPPSVGPKNVLSVTDVQDKALEEKTSDTTIRPPSILIPDFHHAIPKPVDSMDVVSGDVAHKNLAFSTSLARDISPKKNNNHNNTNSKCTSREKPPRDPVYDDYLSPAEDSGDDGDSKKASNDLSAYLSHSISFDRSIDFYMREHEKMRVGSRGPKV